VQLKFRDPINMSSVTDSDLDHLFTFFGSLPDYSAAKKKKDPEVRDRYSGLSNPFQFWTISTRRILRYNIENSIINNMK
jgi:hypothetical protein